MGEDFPQEFGQYTLHELIGRGGMAEIYRASMPGIGGFEKTVAIKKILPHLAEDEEFTTMLVDEARIIESLDHSNIAQVFDLGKLDGSYYIAMEYIHGVDLSEVIEELEHRGERIPIPHVIYILSSICAGLHFAHSKTDEDGNPLNVIHRDVSPHNIRISFAGEVKIIDFGVAKAADREARTKMGVIKGKLLYMAPEQAKAEELDGRADLFSTGLCAYRMLTGELPFEGENEFQVYNNVLQEEIVPPKELRPDLPEELDRIVMKLLERDLEERYQNGYAVKQDLDTLLHELAPGYTVNRLSEFLEENFSHLVRGDRSEGESEFSNSSALPPSTPSRPAPGTGNRSTDKLEKEAEDNAAERENVPARESGEQNRATKAATPGELKQPEIADESDSEESAEPPELPDSAAQDPVDDSADDETPRGVMYAIAALLLAITGMVVYGVTLGGDSRSGSDEAPETRESGAETEGVASSDSMVRVKLESAPSGARLVRKGETVGTTPVEFALPKTDEAIDLRIEKEGYRPRVFQLVPEQDLERTVELVEAAGTDAGPDAAAPDGGTDARTAGEPVAQTSKHSSDGDGSPEERTESGRDEGGSPPDDESGSSGTSEAEENSEEEGGSAPEDEANDSDDSEPHADERSASSDSEQDAPDDESKDPAETSSSPDAGTEEIIDPFAQ